MLLMSRKSAWRDDFILGLTAILLVSLLVGTVLFLSPTFGPATRRITIHFPAREGVAPIKQGSQVILSGVVTVGHVASIEPVEVQVQTPSGVASELMIQVRADVQRDLPLYQDCLITTDQPPVGGNGTVLILDAGSPSKPRLGDEPVRGLPPQSLAAAIGNLSRRMLGPGGLIENIERMLDDRVDGSLTNKISRSLSDVNAMTLVLRTQLDDTAAGTLLSKLHRILDGVNAVTASLRDQTGPDNGSNLLAKLHQLLDRFDAGLQEFTAVATDNRPNIARLTGSLANAAETIDQDLVKRLSAELDRDNPTTLLGKLHAGMDSLNSGLSDVEEIVRVGRQVVVQNRPALDRTVSNFREMSEQLRLTSQELRAAPWRLFYQPTERETREMTLFDAARMFAEAATYLDDAAARLEAVIEAAPAVGATATREEAAEVRESLRAAFERFKRAEEFLYERLR